MTSETPPTDPGRTSEEGDWAVRQFVGPEDLLLSPEEYVARHAHDLAGFGFPSYRFRDPQLGAWVRRVGELLASREEVERCRLRFLSEVETALARRREAEPW